MFCQGKSKVYWHPHTPWGPVRSGVRVSCGDLKALALKHRPSRQTRNGLPLATYYKNPIRKVSVLHPLEYVLSSFPPEFLHCWFLYCFRVWLFCNHHKRKTLLRHISYCQYNTFPLLIFLLKYRKIFFKCF